MVSLSVEECSVKFFDFKSGSEVFDHGREILLLTISEGIVSQ